MVLKFENIPSAELDRDVGLSDQVKPGQPAPHKPWFEGKLDFDLQSAVLQLNLNEDYVASPCLNNIGRYCGLWWGNDWHCCGCHYC